MNNYYIIKSNKIIGVTPKFKEFIINNNFNAPKIPNDVEFISEDAFSKVEYLEGIYLPISIKDLSVKVFERFENIKINYNNFYTIIFRKKDLFGEYNKVYKLSSYFKEVDNYLEANNGILPIIPKWISCIGEYAFKNNNNIKKIIIQNDIAIFKEAFYNCNNLIEIEGSNYIRDYGDECFRKCVNLLNVNIPLNVVNIRSNVFAGCKKIKINIFNIDVVNYKEFTIKDRNLYLTNRKNEFKVLKTNKYYFFVDYNNVEKIYKNQFIYLDTTNKYLGYKYNSKKYFESNLQSAYKLFKKLNYVPYDFIVKNICPSYVDNYLLYKDEFEKVILNKVKTISSKKSLNKNNELVGRLTSVEYETLLKVAIISGFFENSETIRKKSLNLINNYLLPIDSKKGLNLSLNKFNKLFKNINSQNVLYNKEFSEYFLYNKNNLIKLINKIDKSLNSFINLLLMKCGESTIKYKHNDVYEDSSGLLHDEWLIYRNNNNDKHVNINNNTNSTVLSFIDWALSLDERNDYNSLNVNSKIIELFSKYYNDEKSLLKLNEIIFNDIDVTPYIFIPEELTKSIIKKMNVAHIFSNDVIRNIKISIVNNKEQIENIINKEMDLLSYSCDKYKAQMIDKTNIMIAYLNCMMGACSVVTSTGCEYLYEAYFDNETQPFIIFKDDKPIASFRIDLDKNSGFASINSLEVLPSVKFNYSDNEKEKVVLVFDKIINNFIKLYNKYNKVIINGISMGKLSNFDINEILEKRYKTTENSFYIKKRLVCSPSTKNHFIIYERVVKK